MSKVGEIGPDLHLALGDLSNGGTGREQDCATWSPELQGTGSIGLNFYLSSSSAAPLRVFLDDVVARVP